MKWQAYPADVLPAWVAEMDCLPAPAVTDRMQQVLADGDTGYPHGDIYQQAFARYAGDTWGWRPDPATQMMTMPDVMQGIVAVLRLFTDPGDHVVINPPVYPMFYTYLRWGEREALEVPLSEEGSLDLAALADAFAGRRSPKPVAYLLCSPHNPHGSVFTRDELAEVARLAREHSVRVISDEIHAPLVSAPAVHVPYLSVPGSEDAFIITSASKSWNLAGIKAGLAVAGPESASLLGSVPREVTHGASHLGLIAHSAALDDGREWLAQALAEIEANRRLLVDLLANRLPQATYRPGPGTYLAWVDCRGLGLDDPAQEFLRRGRVALNNGTAFGLGGPGFARVNLATSPQILTEVVERMAASLPRP